MTRIELPYPVPLHACFRNARGRGRVPTDRYLSWQKEAWAMIAQQRPQRIKGPVSVMVQLVAPDKRARDGDNLLKAVFDALTKNDIIIDDSGAIIRRFTVQWADQGPPCVVLVQPYEESLAA